MIACLRQNLTRLTSNLYSNNVCKSPAHLSVYFKNFSASSESERESDITTVHRISEMLVLEHNFDAEFVSRVAPKLSDLKKPENACSALSFLKESGFSDDRLEKIVKCKPRLLSASLEDSIKPKIIFFQEMGLSSDGISKMISGNAAVLELRLNDNIIPSVVLLERLLGSKDEVVRFIQKAPRILLYNFETTVLPTIEFFKGLGVPLEQIRTVFASFPTAFLYKLEVLKKSAETAKEMGVDATSNRFIYAVIVIVCFSNKGWKLKLQAMRSLGFSDSDILIMFRKAPPVFMISVEKMKTIIKLLLDTKKYTMSSVVECPLALQYSIEKKFMPRLQTLGILESRNLIQDWPSLAKLTTLTDAKFYKEFVIPYSDKVSAVCSVDKSATVEED